MSDISNAYDAASAFMINPLDAKDLGVEVHNHIIDFDSNPEALKKLESMELPEKKELLEALAALKS